MNVPELGSTALRCAYTPNRIPDVGRAMDESAWYAVHAAAQAVLPEGSRLWRTAERRGARIAEYTATADLSRGASVHDAMRTRGSAGGIRIRRHVVRPSEARLWPSYLA